MEKFQNDTDSKIDDKYIVKGEEVPDRNVYPSLGKFVLDKLESNVDFVGQIDGITDEKYTYGEMRDRSVRCALWMKSKGVCPGDVVVVCSHNQLDIGMPYFATLYLGAVINPLDANLNTRDLVHLIKITKPKMAFASEKSATTIAEAAEKIKLDLDIIVFGRVAGLLEFTNVIAEPKIDEVRDFQCALIQTLDDIALLMCTSGSTGLPKSVALSHGSLLRALHSSEMMQMANHICLVFTPLCWITGTIFVFSHLYTEVTKIIMPDFEEDLACALIEKFKVNWILLGSTMVNSLLKSDALYKYDISCLKSINYGGSRLAADFRKALAKFLPNALLKSGYGSTELGGLISMQSVDSKPDSCGRLVENVQLKIVELDTKRALGPNQKGEILLKGRSMMNRYYGNPQATAEVFDKDGWFYTGDIGYYDEDEEIFVVDRLKELMKYRGFHVSSFEIESVLLSHPGVKEAAVVGQPHPEHGEHPIAFVVRMTEVTKEKVTEVELMDYVAAELSVTKRLYGGVVFVDWLPKSPANKIRRQELRDLAKSMAKI